jgi:hypothetical protein
MVMYLLLLMPLFPFSSLLPAGVSREAFSRACVLSYLLPFLAYPGYCFCFCSFSDLLLRTILNDLSQKLYSLSRSICIVYAILLPLASCCSSSDAA